MARKKRGKKGLIVFLILILIIAGGVGGYFYYKKTEANKTVGTAWGDKYYMYLKTAIEDTQSDRNTTYGFPNGMENPQIQFIEGEENKPPKMALTYSLSGNKYVNIYYIDDNENVGYMSYKQPSEVQLLYNIELEKYIWYVHVIDGNNHSYKPINTQSQEEPTSEAGEQNVVNEVTNTTVQSTPVAENNTATNESTNTTTDTPAKVEVDAEYTFKSDEMPQEDGQKQENLEGAPTPNAEGTTANTTNTATAESTTETTAEELPTILKFEETFVVPEVEDNKTDIDLKSTAKESDIHSAVQGAVDGYKTESKIVTDEVKEETQKALSDLQSKKDAIKKAEEEAKKKAEEEAKKKAEEEAAKGIKAGEYTLQYGTYTAKGYLEETGGPEASEKKDTLVLNKDGTYKSTMVDLNTNETTTRTGKYSIGTFQGKNSLQLDGSPTFMVTGNNEFEMTAGAGAKYTYQGS